MFKQADDGSQGRVRALKVLTSSVKPLLGDGGKCFLSLQSVVIGLTVRSNGCLFAAQAPVRAQGTCSVAYPSFYISAEY